MLSESFGSVAGQILFREDMISNRFEVLRTPQYIICKKDMPDFLINAMTSIIRVLSGFMKKQDSPRLQGKTDRLLCVKYCNNVTGGSLGFDTVRSIVASRAWSALDARFALTNSAHLPLALPTGEAFTSFAPGLRPCVRILKLNIIKTALPQGEGCFDGTPGGIRFRSLNRRLSRLKRARCSFRANKLESLPLRGQPTGLTLLSFATAPWVLICRADQS